MADDPQRPHDCIGKSSTISSDLNKNAVICSYCESAFFSQFINCSAIAQPFSLSLISNILIIVVTTWYIAAPNRVLIVFQIKLNRITNTPYGCHKLLHENLYFIETVVICCVYLRNYSVFQIQWNNLVLATVTCLKLLCKALVQSSKITEHFNKARTKYCSPGFLFLVIINTGFSNIQDFPSRDVTRVVQIIIH